MAVIISYPTGARGIIVLKNIEKKIYIYKRPKKITRKLTIFLDHGLMAHNP